METGSTFSDVEWLARTDDVNVRILTLAPDQGTPWHFHTAVTDNVFSLDGEVEVGLRGPDETLTLRPGERKEIAPGCVHRVVNRTGRSLRYLLVQATGRYDFNTVE